MLFEVDEFGTDWIGGDGKNIGIGVLNKALVQLIETSTHEETHIQRGEEESVITHTPVFLQHQRRLLNALVALNDSSFDIYSILENLQRNYKPNSQLFALPFGILNSESKEKR